MKILILKPSSLGDVIQALPVLRLIRREFPQSEVYWWIDSRLAPLLEGDPDLAGVIPFERRGWGKPSYWVSFARTLRWMRSQHFDWVIDLQCLARSGSIAWLANGDLLAGLDEVREGARGFYDLAARRPSWYTHAADWYLEVLRLLKVPTNVPFDWMPIRKEISEELRRKWPVENHPWILLQPGARWLNKRWPVEHFATLVQALAARHPDHRFAILGGQEDRELGATIAKADPVRCLDLTGRLTLPEMVEWIRFGRLMVTNDTGPMHVAAAMGKPVVALLGPTEPCRTGPYGQVKDVLQLDLPCVPCMKSRCTQAQTNQCLRALRPAPVIKAVEKRLEAGGCRL